MIINTKKLILKLFLENQEDFLFKDCLPYLFHTFRNNYLNKISLGNMLYVQNELYRL